MIGLFNVLVALIGFISASLTAANVIGWIGVILILLSLFISFFLYRATMYYALHKISKDSSNG